MSKFLATSVGIFLVGVSAQAGTPDQDPVTASIRSRFAAARAPALEELRVGEQWVCRSRDASRNSFSVGGYRTGFVRFDSLFRDSLGNARYRNSDYALAPTGLITSFRIEDGIDMVYNYRFERTTGSLVAEISAFPDSSYDFSTWELKPVTAGIGGARVGFYAVCIQCVEGLCSSTQDSASQ